MKLDTVANLMMLNTVTIIFRHFDTLSPFLPNLVPKIKKKYFDSDENLHSD